jgi:hypothetical protein
MISGKVDAWRSPVDPLTIAGESAGVNGFAGPDPAERSAFNRLFYRNRRPT